LGILERIKSVTEAKNDSDIARLLNVPPKKLAVWKLRNTIPYDELITFCRDHDLELEWVLTGEHRTRVTGGPNFYIQTQQIEGVKEPLVFMEEPEAHLHPALAAKVIGRILEALTEEQRKDVLKYAAEKKELADFQAGRQKDGSTKKQKNGY
jgi:hypothetical protein